MNRRGFLQAMLAGATVTAGGLLLPHEPRRVYSFAPPGGWLYGRRRPFIDQEADSVCVTITNLYAEDRILVVSARDGAVLPIRTEWA